MRLRRRAIAQRFRNESVPAALAAHHGVRGKNANAVRSCQALLTAPVNASATARARIARRQAVDAAASAAARMSSGARCKASRTSPRRRGDAAATCPQSSRRARPGFADSLLMRMQRPTSVEPSSAAQRAVAATPQAPELPSARVLHAHHRAHLGSGITAIVRHHDRVERTAPAGPDPGRRSPPAARTASRSNSRRRTAAVGRRSAALAQRTTTIDSALALICRARRHGQLSRGGERAAHPDWSTSR